ncbi:MAG TPA: polysaccharide deacetylase family protein [Symbiobacteriaceae bacterium]|nr:polysaccharide deacetylase family protein [Symbiobacteriaceae bacterium]
MSLQTRFVAAGALVAVLAAAGALWPRSWQTSAGPNAPVPLPPATADAAEPVPAPPVPPVVTPPPTPLEPERVVYAGPVEHIFFHPLVAFPELAFDGDGLAQGYNDWFVTVPEFRQIMEQLYANGYMLVDIQAAVTPGKLRLPPGKKPLVLSVDDINYYDYMRANGNVYKLVLDSEGRVATYAVTPAGEPILAYDNEIVPLVDAFVARHPDFSLDGAKGVLALTGYEGILGYRTNELQAPSYPLEKAEALQVVQRLKETGWSFASHSWGHQDAAKLSLGSLERDTQRWKAEVESLIGPTPVYIYPFGSGLQPEDPKFAMLQRLGFRIFCGVGPTPYLHTADGYAIMDRRHIDGMALQQQKKLIAPLFDADSVLDPVREER